jgi:TetR/AcrR family transcriptional regulator, mexJK operon transcriptional repressor
MERQETTALSPRAQAKRAQIRSAAQRLFLARGFAGTSTDAIAGEAGVSKQTLYVYYASKEALLGDVLQEFLGALSSGPEGEQASPVDYAELRARMLQLAHHLIDSLMQPEYLAMVRVIVAETSRLPQIGALFASAVPRRVLETVAALLVQAQDRGLLRVDTPDVAARLLLGPLLTYVLLDGLFADTPRPPRSEQIERIVDLFLRGVGAAPREGSAVAEERR